MYSLCELRSPKFEVSGDGPVEADDNSTQVCNGKYYDIEWVVQFCSFIVKYLIVK